MPTHADNYTSRVRGSYIAAGIPHKVKVRSAGVFSSPALPEALAEILNNYMKNFEADLADDWAWTGWEYANVNSDEWIPMNPVLTAEIEGQVAIGTYSPYARVTACTHSGRAFNSKARIYFYGLLVPTQSPGNVGGDGVLTSSEVTGLAASTSMATESFRAGSGAAAIFYERLTYKVNDDLLKQVRRGLI